MNLRKSRFSIRPKRNSPCKGIKSSAKTERPPLRSLKNIKSPSKRSLETPSKHQKSALDDTLIINSSPNINLITSTPISHDVRKRITKSSTVSSGKSELKSLNVTSCPVISSPIQRSQIKSCQIRLKPILPRGKRYSDPRKVDQILKEYGKASNNQSSLLSNSRVGISRKSVHSRRSSMTLRSYNASDKISNGVPKSASKKSTHYSKSAAKCKNLNNNVKSVKKKSVPIKDVHAGKKIPAREWTVCLEKLHPSITLVYENECSIPDKANELSKTFHKRVTRASQDGLLQSCSEDNNSKASRYSLRNSDISPKKLYSKNKKKDKKRISTNAETVVSPLAPKNFIPDSNTFNRVSRRNNKSHNVKLSLHFQPSCSSMSEKLNEISKTSRYNLRLQDQRFSKRTSARLSSKAILKSQETKTPNNLLDSSADDSEVSIYSLRLEKVQPSVKASANKVSQNSSKKSSTKKQKLVKKNDQTEASKSSKKNSCSLKKQTPPKKSTKKFRHNFFSFSENVTIDDLALTFTTPAKRKVKSDGFKVPTLKRKRDAIEAVIKADEDYEDDLYEKQDFNKFKDILLDTSDSEISFTIATPKFPCTPLMHYKTPKFRDIISPAEFAMRRKAAMEINHKRQQKRRRSSNVQTVAENKNSETPVLAEKKKLEYSKILADAQKLQNTIESLVEEESDNDSYFSL